jgi:DNA-binding beta-propeller fold protein YncE
MRRRETVSRATLIVAICLLTSLPGRTAVARDDATFRGPFGVDVDGRDVIYVAEIGAKRVTKLTTDGKRIGEISRVEGYGELAGPFDVAVAADGRIAIADTRNHRVLVVDAAEKLLFVLGSDKGAAPGQFAEPHFVAFTRAGELLVSDTFNARIQKFSAEGKFIREWGRVGDAPGEFLHHGYLASIDTDEQGFVYVREFDGGRIQKYDADGRHIATFSRRGTAPGELDEGYGLTVVGEKLYCADTFESRIQIFSLDGKLLDVWSPGEGNSGEHLNHPAGIAATLSGDLIVTDWKNDRVLKLDPRGKFLAIWGRSMDELLAWKPPREPIARPARGPVRFGAYAGTDAGTLERAREAGVSIIYPSIDHQYRDWGLPAQVASAASMGIEVHPSIACHSFGQGITNSDVFERHPEWCIWKKGAAEPMRTLLGWSNAHARSFRADHIVAQVKATGVQGVMLDYIRYLGTDYGYDPAVIEGFFRVHGVNPVTLPQDDSRWMQYRADFVTDFIVELRRKLAVEIPDRHVEISVYLSGDDPSPGKYLKASMQDWKTWARMGIVDKLNVAQYTRDLDEIYAAVRRVREAVPDRVKINSFIACYGGNLNTPELLAKGIEASLAGGADEITIYRGDAIEELKLWPAIRQGVERTVSETK